MTPSDGPKLGPMLTGALGLATSFGALVLSLVESPPLALKVTIAALVFATALGVVVWYAGFRAGRR
ncbi:MAG: hypothetical protein QOE69_1395 [Thermoleophilaceae bacterium]|jgi:hypothetical protein|nr:hypothetical protein [Thermoleophilaceae bacterium]MEA2407276.1 hypothetical protein [Thermoleophilaceae bacterium]